MTMFDDFAAPAPTGGDKLDLHAVNGSLLIFEVSEDIEHVQTSVTQPGEKTSAVRADIHVVDGALAGTTRKDALVFPRMLQAQLRPNVGRKVLGRLRRGTPTAPGKSAPWELAEATDDDKSKAIAFLSRAPMPSNPSPAMMDKLGAEAPF